MERLEKFGIGRLMILLGLSLFAFQTGCSSTARPTTQPFQPRPFQAQSMRSQPFSDYPTQEAFYPPQAGSLQGYAPEDPNNQAVYSRNKFGFPFGQSQVRWPNFRPAQNPLGFAGTSC